MSQHHPDQTNFLYSYNAAESDNKIHSDGLPRSSLPPLISNRNTYPTYSVDAQALHTPPLKHRTLPASSSQPAPYVSAYAPTAKYYNPAENYPQHAQPQAQIQRARPAPLNAGPPPQSRPSYTSAPPQARLPELLPMPPRGDGSSFTPVEDQYAREEDEEPQPTHVVGSQGRRGILPSAAGRPVAVPNGDANGHKPPLPPRNDDGKYPCPHCTKTYLHAKHLKRHLLRHTGDRPYTCGLCKDTFSRSDILKRHFQKCSQRRGNPSGENHLTHSRKNKAGRVAEDEALIQPPLPDAGHQMASAYTPTALNASFVNALDLGRSSYGDSSTQVSRANSVKRAKGSTGSSSNRASLGLVNTSGYEYANYPSSTGHVTPDSVTTSGAATPYTHPHETRSNQITPNGTYSASGGSLDLGYAGGSRVPASSTYHGGPLPHIAGQGSGRSHDYDWPAVGYHSQEEYCSSQYHSGTNTPLYEGKPDVDYSDMPLPDYHQLHSKA